MAGDDDKPNWRRKQKQVIWRQSKVHELLIIGHNQTQIANILKVSEGTISKDVSFLKEKARDNLKKHLEYRLPIEYENCIAGINQILKMSWEIAMRGQSEEIDKMLSKVDDKTRLQALALASDCYKYKIDLTTNGVLVADAVKFVQQKKEEAHKLTESSMNLINDDPLGKNVDSSQTKAINKIF